MSELIKKSLSFLKAKLFNSNHLQVLTLFALCTLVFSINIIFSSDAIFIDSDSGFEYTNAQNLLQNKGLEHGPVVQQFLYALILGIFGPDYKNILMLQSIVTTLLVLVTFQFVRRQTNFCIASISSLLFLLFPTFYWGNLTLKQYPLLLLFLMLSIYYFDRYMGNKERRSMVFSAAFLGLGTMTHLLSLPFIGLFMLYYLFGRLRGKHALTLNEVIQFYLMLFLIISPYLIWRILVDGLSLDLLLTYPNKWHTIKYGKLTNIEFWGMPPPFTFDYYRGLLGLLIGGVFLPILSPFFVVGLTKHTDKKLVICWFLVLVAPWLVGRGVRNWIYTYFFMPLVVVLSAQGIHTFTQLRSSKRIRLFTKGVIMSIIIALSILSFGQAIVDFGNRKNKDYPAVQDLLEFNDIITEGSNILFRSRAISPLLPHKNVFQIQDLSEEDAIIYLDWENDEAVSNVFMKYDIFYVILYKDLKWEIDIHVWFKTVTGHEPNHYYRIRESPYFEEVNEGNSFILYKFMNGKTV